MNQPAVTVNPVLRRELVERMRRGRTAIVLTAYLVLLSGILYLLYRVTLDMRTDPWESAIDQVAGAGRGIFEWLVFFTVLLVLFLVPAVTAGAIAGERERQTLVPLQVTLMRPVSILLGKIGASTAFLVLLLVASMPLLAVSYLIGGVSAAQVLAAVAMVAATGVGLAAISAGISACVRRVQVATVLSYAVTLALVVGTLLAYAVAGLIDSSRGTDEADPPAWILVPNPLAAMADVIEDDGGHDGIGGASPFDGLEELIIRGSRGARDQGVAVVAEVGPGGFTREILVDERGNEVGAAGGGTGFAWWSMGCLAALAATGVAVGSRRMRAPAGAER